MSLSDFEIGYELVESRRGSFKVRGMSSEDLVYLTNGYLPDMIEALEAYGRKIAEAQPEQGLGLFNRKALPEIILMLTKDFPELVAEMISRCADEPDLLDKARKLPLVIQIDAVSKIASLTIEEAGGLKNLGAVLLTLLEGNLTQGPLRSKLQSIIGQFGQTPAS